MIIATHLPFADSGLFFLKAHPHRSYAVAAPIEADAAPDGMFINSGTPTRSVRTIRDGDSLLLQVGGQGHRPGDEEDTPGRYRALEEFLGEHWPQADAVAHRWSTQDYMAVDRVPYIGRLRRTSQHVFTATGYSKWGMTGGTLAAMLLSDRILGRENPWAELYDAKRIDPKASLKRLLTGNMTAGLHFVADRLKADRRDPESLAPGEGCDHPCEWPQTRLLPRRGRARCTFSRPSAATSTATSSGIRRSRVGTVPVMDLVIQVKVK